jgi:succinyl-diaminopimelate desuccinylase
VNTLELAQQLISRTSVTPDDAGCQKLIADLLATAGYQAAFLSHNAVDNLWLSHGQGEPVFTLLGHTDVVPAGRAGDWQSPPFQPELRGGYLYGRGAADMKGSVAAMVTALQRFTSTHPDHQGTLALLLTSDEEGMAIDGTRRVVEYLQQNKIAIKWCLVGEPSSNVLLGDTIKNGRRGSLTGWLTAYGVQGHVAYPERASNPVHAILPALNELCSMVWDEGNEFYPPTSLQISNINAGTGADNVIPGSAEVVFNFRYSTETDENTLKDAVQKLLESYDVKYDLRWHASGLPFLTATGTLLDAATQAVQEITGRQPALSTAGGTSDGRFIAPTGAEVIELGPVNATIHKVDECVLAEDLETLSLIYERIVEKLLI